MDLPYPSGTGGGGGRVGNHNNKDNFTLTEDYDSLLIKTTDRNVRSNEPTSGKRPLKTSQEHCSLPGLVVCVTLALSFSYGNTRLTERGKGVGNPFFFL